MRLFHLVHRQIYAIEQSRPALGLSECEAILDLFRVGSEAHHEFRPIVELHEEELIFRICGLEKLRGGLARFRELAPHAAAGVEYESHTQRSVLARELRDGLLG